MKHTRLTSVALTLALGLAVLSVQAAEGRTPIYEPTVLNAPGKYIVTRNIFSPGGPVITCAASDIDIDLNGMLIGSAAAATPVILCDGFNGIRIHNGSTQGGSESVLMRNAINAEISGIQVSGTSNDGIVLQNVTDYRIEKNELNDVPNNAILVDGAVAGAEVHGSIRGNQISLSGVGIVVRSSTSTQIEDNRIYQIIGAEGIQLDNVSSSSVRRNNLQAIAGDGVVFVNSHGNAVERNVISRAGGNGLLLIGASMNNQILYNNMSQSNGHGLLIDAIRNHVEGNLCNENNLWGVWFTPASSENVFRGNTSRGNNPGGFAVCGGFVTPDLCNEGPGNSTNGDNWMPFLL